MSRSDGILSNALDWLLLALLLLPATAGMILYGGVRLWVSGPLMVVVYLAGAVVCVRWMLNPGGPDRSIPPALPVLVVVAAYTLLRIPHSAVPYEASLEFFKILSYAVVYLGVFLLCVQSRRWQIVLGVLLLLGSLDCWYAIAQHLKGSNLVLLEPRPEQYGMRASGTYVCPNHFAYLLSLYVTIAVGICFTSTVRWWLRILAAYTLVVSLPVLLLTQSRSGWIATVAGVSTVLLLSAKRRGAKRLVITIALLALLGTLVSASLWQFSTVFRTRVEQAMRGNMRTQVWQDTLQAIEERPAFGHGPGSYRWIYAKYNEVYRTNKSFPRYAHNEYLQMAAEYGLVGTGLLLVGLGIVSIRLLRVHRDMSSRDDARLLATALGCLAATAAHAVFDFQLHVFANVHVLLVVLAALGGRLVARRSLPVVRLRPRVGAVIGLFAALGLLAAIVPLVRRTTAYLYTEQARLLREEDMEVDAGLAAAERAIDFDHGYWMAYREIGQMLQARARVYFEKEERPRLAREAEHAFQTVLELNPYEIETKLDLSKLYRTTLRYPDAAMRELREASDLAPNHFYFQYQIGVGFLDLGRTEDALVYFRHASSLHPSDRPTKTLVRSLEKHVGVDPEAKP